MKGGVVNMWWILQIVGCVGVTVAQIFNRKFGFSIQSWVIYSGIAMWVTYFAFAKSYAIAPSFFGAWFVGQTALNILGLLVSFIVFKDVVTTPQWIGLVLSIVGGYLLIK
jgi:multidrug transporter EmrE-like cation transporter